MITGTMISHHDVGHRARLSLSAWSLTLRLQAVQTVRGAAHVP